MSARVDPLEHAETVEAIQWPTPQPLPEVSPPAPPMPDELVPDVLRPWLLDFCERSCTPLEAAAIAAMVTLSAVVGRRLGVLPKRKDDWTVSPNLWGCIVAPPGLLKTAILQEAVRPLRRIEAEIREDFLQKQLAWERRVGAAKAKLSDKSALKSLAEDERRELELAANEPQPAERRLVVNDVTVEALAIILGDNPDGALMLRDELAGWLSSLELESQKHARAFYLEAWNGSDGFYRVDRVTRESLVVRSPTVSVLGTTQPAKLHDYVKQVSDSGGDGLLQRFQLLVWLDSLPEWRNVDKWPDSAAKNAARCAFKAIHELNIGALDPVRLEYSDIPALRFSDEAQELFDSWRDELERRLRGELLQAPSLGSHLSKYRSLMPSLSLLFHLLDTVSGEASDPSRISAGAAALAADWSDYLELHARRLYAHEMSRELQGAHLLAELIRRGDVRDGDALRDIYRRHRSGLATPEAVRDAAAELERLGWVKLEQMPTGKRGRPAVVIRVNPEVEYADL